MNREHLPDTRAARRWQLVFIWTLVAVAVLIITAVAAADLFSPCKPGFEKLNSQGQCELTWSCNRLNGDCIAP